MPKQHHTDHGAELEKAFARWDYLYEHGGQDPGYADGVNLNLVRNHVIYHRRQLEDHPPLFGFPECYYRDIPPEVDNNFMTRPDEIRAAARASLEAYRADPDYQFILAHREEIPPKMRDKLCVGAVLGYVSGLERSIAKDELVDMRRHGHPAGYLDSFVSCVQRMRDFMSSDMDSADASAPSGPEDESFDEELDEGFGEDFDDEPEEGFGGMTMTM